MVLIFVPKKEEKMTEFTKKSKTPYFLFGVFVLPLLIAVAMYSLRDHLTFSTPTAHGELVHPAQPIITLQLVAGEQVFDLESMQGKWNYLVYVDKSCDLICETALFKIRQAALATGREISRVQYFLVIAEDASADAGITRRHPKLQQGQLQVLNLESPEMKAQLLHAGDVLLVDPNGNIMMRYDDQATSKGMLKDVKKLLKLSNIG